MVIGKQCRQDQTLHNVGSDQALHCLLKRFSIRYRIKVTDLSDTPKMINGLVQHAMVEESTGLKCVYLLPNLSCYKTRVISSKITADM